MPAGSNATHRLVTPEHGFHIADYVVFGLAIMVSLGIGVFHAIRGIRKNNTGEYLVGGRSMSVLPTAISLLASFESSIMMLGMPAEAYVFGLQNIWSIFGGCCSQVLAVAVLVPLIHPLKITSAYEYLELRFKSKAIRLVGTTLGTLSYTWYMGIVLFGPAVALQAVSGYPVWNSIVVISVVAVIYTSIGGIKAVIWTDVFQGFVMWAGIFAILIQGTVDVGSPKKVWDTAAAGGRLNFFNFDPDPRVRHTFWNLFFGSLVRTFGMVFNQSTVQRISSIATLPEAKRMLQITAPIFFVTLSIATYEGIVAYAYYQHKECDPLESNQITDPNQIIPFTVMDIFRNLGGMPGLFLASLFCASLSTLSSGLASVAALTWTDVIHPLIGDISESKSTIIIKLTVVVFGGIACGVSFMVAEIGGTLTQIAGTLISAFSTPLTGIFLLGCFCPRSNAKGAMVGAATALVVCVWISMGQNFSPNIPKPVTLPPASTAKCYVNITQATTVVPPENRMYMREASTPVYLTAEHDSKPEPKGIEVIYTLSYMYIGTVGTLGTMIVGYIASFCFGANKPGDVDPRYLLSVTDSLLFFLPARVKRYISSIGPQFMETKYMAMDGDNTQEGNRVDMDPKILPTKDKSANDRLEEVNVKPYDLQESYGTRL